MDGSTPVFTLLHYLHEFAQTHVHWVGGAIQLSHSLSSPSPAFNPSQHQGRFQWVSSSHHVAKVLEFQLQHQCFQWTPRTDFLYDGLVGSPCRPSYSQESSPTPQFKSINSSTLNLLYDPTLTSVHDYWKKTQLWLYGPLSTKWWLWFLISCLRVTTKTMHLTKRFFIIMFNLLQQPCMVVLFCTFWR